MDVKDKPVKEEENTLNIVEWLFDAQGNLRNDTNSQGGFKIEFTDDNLDILETGGKNALVMEEDDENPMEILLNKKVKLNKKAKLLDLYPKLQPVMPKPFFFDIAADAIEYPNIDETIKELEGKQTPSGGLLGKIKGFWS